MKNTRPYLLPLTLAALLLAPPVHAEEPAALASIGFLNGMVLACKQPALAARVREAVVSYAPKTREAGEVFEQATNMAFLGYGDGSVCPDARTLSGKVDEAIADLKAAYNTK